MPEGLGLSMKSFLQSREAGKTYPDFLPPTAPYGTGEPANGSRFNPKQQEGGIPEATNASLTAPRTL
jgi:hypothetical protein